MNETVDFEEGCWTR